MHTPLALCFGELLIDMVSTVADAGLDEARDFLKAPGGAPANVAVGLQKLGVASRFVGGIGSDPFGDFLRATLKRQNVDVSGLVSLPNARTTIAFVATRRDGSKDICFYRNPGADAQFEIADLPDFAGVSLAHFGSVSLSLEPCRSAQWEAVSRAKNAGALISFDPNWRPSLWPNIQDALALIGEMMKQSDIVKIADEEWEFVTQTADFASGAAKILEIGPKLVVMTRGKNGATFAFTDENGAVSSGEVEGLEVKAFDTLGAGDAFVAGLLSQILVAQTLDSVLNVQKMTEILRFANACGAFATQKAGAIPSLPAIGDVYALLEANKM